MKYVVIIFLLLLAMQRTYADYDPTKTAYPYQYENKGYSPEDGVDIWESIPLGYSYNYEGSHNANAKKNNGFISFQIKDNGLYSTDCYKWYVEAFYERKTGVVSKRFFALESAGTINLNRLASKDIDNVINTTPIFSKFIVFGGDPNYKLLTVYFNDFPFDITAGLEYSLRVVVIKESGVTCGEEELIGEYFLNAGEWAYYESHHTINILPESSLNVNVSNTEICSGSTTGNTTTATISGATGATTITLADAGKGGATFNPSYATVVGDVITINPTCPAGVYTVKATVTDEVPATAETEFTFTVNQTPRVTLTAGQTPVCSGDGTTLTAVTNPSGSYTYKWEEKLVAASTYSNLAGTGATQTLTGLTASKDYRVIAANGSCRDTVDAPVRIEVNPAPSFNIVPNAVTICQGELVSLTATKTNGDNTGITFAWNQGTSLTGPWTPVSGQTTNNLQVTPATAGDIYYQVVGTLNGCPGTQQQKVTVNAKPNLNVTTQPTAVCDGAAVNLASATLTGSVGTPTYFSDASCTTTSPSTVTIAAANSPKDYWVVVKNASGCSDTATLTATVNPLPTKPTITGGTELCAGSSITINAPAGHTSYVWKAGSTVIAGNAASQTIAPTANTSYTVEVTNASGCKNTSDAHSVTVNQKPVVTITPPAAACAGSTVSLTATVTGGSNSYTTYTWTGATQGTPATAASATLAAGNNTVKLVVTDNKTCTGENTITVVGNSIDAKLTASPAAIADGNTSTLTAIFTPTSANGQYEFWEVTPTKQKIQAYSTTNTRAVTPSETTTYRVITKNTIGCVDSADATVTVQEKPLSVGGATPPPAICEGTTSITGTPEIKALVQNGAKPYKSVQWTELPAWLQVDRTDSAVIKITGYSSAAVKGNYTVTLTVTDAKNVTKTTSTTLVVNGLPTILINGAASGDLAVCKNTPLTLIASGGTSYAWTAPTASSGATRVVTTTTADAGTNYTVVGTTNGCSTTVTRKVIIRELPVITIDAVNTDATICSGDMATLAATGGATYSWSNGGAAITGSPIATPALTASTTYTVTGTDANGCTNTAAQLVTVNPLPTITITPAPAGAICEGTSVTLTADGATTYAWTGGSTTADYTFTPTATATYEVTGTDANGCQNTKQHTVTVTAKPVLALNTPVPGCGNLVDLRTLIRTSGTTPGLTYKYYDSGNNELTGAAITVSTGGTYKVEGFTAGVGGCSTGKVEVDVVIHPNPTVTLAADKEEYCSGDTVRLTATVPNPDEVTYAWTPSALGTSSTAKDCPVANTAARTITYSVTATITATGCDFTATKSITVNPRPQLSGTFNPATNPIPEGSSLVLTVASTYGQPNPTYTWVTPAGGSGNTATVTPVKPPSCDFKVFAVDANGCKSDTLEKSVAVTPQGGVLDVTIEAAEMFVCTNGMTVLTANPENGNAPYSYSWAKDGVAGVLGTDKVLNVTTAGKYIVTVTDGSTPVQTKTAEVTISSLGQPAPVANAGADQTIAMGSSTVLFGSATGGAAIRSYVWSPLSELVADMTTANPTTVALSGLQKYTLYVKDANGCISNPDEVTIDVNTSNPEIRVVASPATICKDNTSQFRVIAENGTLSASATYEWTPSTGLDNANSASPKFTGTAQGTFKYVVKITDGANVYGGKVSVTVQNSSAPKLAFATSMPNCDGDKLIVNNTGTTVSGTGYTWFVDGVARTGQGNEYTLPVGTHNVTVIAAGTNGCASDSVKTSATIYALPVIQFASGNPTTVVEGTVFNMVAELASGSDPVTAYNWTSPTAVTGATYVATAAGASMTFTLTGESDAGCKSAPITTTVTVTPSGDRLKVTANIESEVVCKGGAAYLSATATKGTPGYTYKWFVEGVPGTILSSDSTFVAKPTVATNYVVQVTDNNLPIANTAFDTVRLTMGANTAPVADAGADMTVVSGSTTVLFGSATGGASGYTYTWSPLDKLSVDKTTASPTTIGLTSAQTYSLYVTDANGCKSKPDDVLVSVLTDAEFFAIEATASPQTICMGNTSILGVKVTQGTMPDDVKYLWTPNTNLSATNVASPKFTPTSAGTFDYYVTVITNTSPERYTSAKVTVTVTSDNAPQIAFDGAPRCVGDTIYVKHTGEPAPTGYDRFVSLKGITTKKENTLENFYKFAESGNYNVKFVAHAGSCNSDTISGNYTIGEMLKATVTPEYLVEAKDAVHSFEVTAPVGNYGYEWSGVVYNAAGAVVGGATNPVDASTKNSAKMVSTPLKGDVRYIVKVTDDAGIACPASDTVWAYVLPDAPTIDIDTAVSRVTAKISWGGVDNWATGSTIMGRKWDPYCMTSADGGKYTPVKNGNVTSSTGTWAVPTMDTLEFYYMTSYRVIPAISATDKHYAKTTSDTVGYYLYDFHINSAASGLYSNTWYSWYFDMSSKGIAKSSDVIIKTEGSISTVRQRDHSTQSWGLATMEDMFDPGRYLDEFPLVQGTVMEFEVVNPCKFMQYGKLPKPIEFVISGANNGYNNNLVFLQPFRLNLKESKDVILHIGTNIGGDDRVSTVRRWNFALQEIDLSTMRDMFDPTEFLDSFKIIPLMPLEVENPNVGNDILWK